MSSVLPTKPKQNGNIDILKFVMALMIVWLHSGFWCRSLSPLLRIPVPVFFIITSWFFFRKLFEAEAKEDKEGRNRLMRFTRRNLILYGFWFVATFPVTYLNRQYGDMGLIRCIGEIIYGVTLQSTFVASWFISASVICVAIVYALRRHLSVPLGIGALLYLLCCINTNYYHAFPAFNEWWEGIVGNYALYTSFPAGLYWVAFGAVIARRGSEPSPMSVTPWLVCSLLLLAGESIFVMSQDFQNADDCYLSLMIVAPLLFLWILAMKPREFSFAVSLRKASTIFYCLHGSVIRILYLPVGMALGMLPDMALKGIYLILAIIICSIASYLLITLSRRQSLHWLKYSY